MVFSKQMLFKIGFITNWITTFQILFLCLSQVNMEFCIKLIEIPAFEFKPTANKSHGTVGFKKNWK
jgi:hypothetical protein